MSETKRYAVDSEFIGADRIRVLFHCEELHRETNPSIRTTIALSLAEAATTLARLEAEAAQKVTLLMA